MKDVYIVRTAAFLPNDAVTNEKMEKYLGYINGKKSRSRKIVLRSNGIKQRYYALTESGMSSHSNAAMTEQAIRRLFGADAIQLADIELLCCGTSTPDQMIPSHAVMVHGLLPETSNIEVISTAGVCCSGMHALKYAYMSVKSGEKNNAVAAGSERISPNFLAGKFEEEVKKIGDLEGNGYLAFEKDFLRWMLSDGAGAFMLTSEKKPTEMSLRIDWIEAFSFAHEIEPCMYMGCEKMEDGSLKSHMDFEGQEIIDQSVLSVKQDTRLLREHIIELGIKSILTAVGKHDKCLDDVSHFLPHISSYFFKPITLKKFKERGINLQEEKWFTNLDIKGNVGAASIYLMVDELLRSGKLNKGEKLLLFIPESARFSYVIAWLTVC